MNNDENVFFDIQFGGEAVKRIVFYLYDDTHPITCKNFRELAKGTYGFGYKGCIFHRVITQYAALGGDVIYNNGTGYRSIYGQKFKDENFNFKHTKPELLSMSNGGPNTNGSQFFITFVPCPWLDNKHVVFGEVAQETSDVIDSIEQYSSVQGTPKIRIQIINCGTLGLLKNKDGMQSYQI